MDIPGIVVWCAVGAIVILFFWSRSLKSELGQTKTVLSKTAHDLAGREQGAPDDSRRAFEGKDLQRRSAAEE